MRVLRLIHSIQKLKTKKRKTKNTNLRMEYKLVIILFYKRYSPNG